MGYRRRMSRRDRARLVVGALVAVLALAGLGNVTGSSSASSSGATTASAAAAPASVSGNVATGQALASGYGWGSGQQWNCLYDLWMQESSWNNTAQNASGAYGISQALPPSKLPAAALPPESSASAQISWGLSYIQTTYTDPCGAWSHEEADGWY